MEKFCDDRMVLQNSNVKELLDMTLKNEKVKLRKVETNWSDPFWMVDMSEKTMGGNIISFLLNNEDQVIQMYAFILNCLVGEIGWAGWEASCARDLLELPEYKDYTPLVLDVGANAGFYGLLSASFGWEILSIEPQPHCNQWIRLAAIANGFGNRYITLTGLAGLDESITADVNPRSGCWGTYPRTTSVQIKQSENLFFTDLEEITIGTKNLDNLLYDTNYVIPLLKIDVEGFEYWVIQSAMKLLKARRIQHIFIEIGFIFWESAGVTHEMELEMLLGLMDLGYNIKCHCFGHWTNQVHTTRQQLKELLEPGVDILTTDCWLSLK
eukprot:TRINITY_DN2560_c0_g1_i12.p1 TRINITY_DN2560_c0_g1~~TRINITY_DN2560_c0_g1_i12.p1  ORF type:complete len:325 (+),score=104.45 TRINITY_DN2560_c0_g1_i12:428-1402(+)